MSNKNTARSLDEASFVVERGVYARHAPKSFIADLSGKGVNDSAISNRSKMNFQNS